MGLTVDALRAAIETARPTMYYTITEALSPGETLRVASDGFWPEVWHVHPDDLAALRPDLAQRYHLVDIREWGPTAEANARAAAAWCRWPDHQIPIENDPSHN